MCDQCLAEGMVCVFTAEIDCFDHSFHELTKRLDLEWLPFAPEVALEILPRAKFKRSSSFVMGSYIRARKASLGIVNQSPCLQFLFWKLAMSLTFAALLLSHLKAFKQDIAMFDLRTPARMHGVV